MNTTETNSPLTPIQALHRCLEWFTMHQPAAVLPGTKLTAVQELQSVIVSEPTENAKFREVLEIVRRYALVGYGESASCRVIASEIQQVLPCNVMEIKNSMVNELKKILPNGQETENPTP